MVHGSTVSPKSYSHYQPLPFTTHARAFDPHLVHGAHLLEFQRFQLALTAMGSSKKSSDKDKERDREVRKKRRDRSRER